MKQAVCLSLLCCGVLAANIPKPQFAARRVYQSQAGYVSVADINGDGIPDIVTADGATVSTLLGNGDGTFRPGPYTYLTAETFDQIAVDLNGDGKIDLAIGTELGLAVCLGNGDGTFQPAVYYGNGGDGYVAVGDFNGDGIPDIVSVDFVGVWLFIGKGGGVFNPAIFTPIQPQGATNGSMIVAADFNGDGNLDVAVSYGLYLNRPPGFLVLYGKGDGTFQKPIFHQTTRWPQWLATGDLNRSGHADLVAVEGATYVYFNNGKGDFFVPTVVDLPGNAYGQIAIGDVNGDHIPDLVSSAGYVALGLGKGQFAPAASYPLEPNADAVTLADLRHNGLLDIVTAENDSVVSVLLNEGNGTFQNGQWTSVPATLNCGAAADFNGDGKPDLAVASYNGIVILLGTGMATEPYIIGATIAGSGSGCPVTGDVNGDGIPDLLVGASNGIEVYLGNGDGTFQQASVLPVSSFVNLVVGDFNHDGKLDLATSSNQLALGNGDGTFQSPVPYIANLPEHGFNWLVAGDLNNDGWTDLIASARIYGGDEGWMFVLLNDHNGKFQQKPFKTEAEAEAFTLADLNLDGNLDAVISESDYAICYLGDGTGGFKALKGFVPSPGLGSIYPLVGDVNGDGIPDVLLGTNGTIAIALGRGDGTFLAPWEVGAGPYVSQIFLENLHGQSPAAGLPDLVAPDAGVAVLINTTK